MHPCSLTASEKAASKGRPSHLVSSAWCLWIVHECDFRLQAKMNFSINTHKVGFQRHCQIRIRISEQQLHVYTVMQG